MDYEQTSIFDISLPKNEIETVQKVTEQQPNKINFAIIPEEEQKAKPMYKNIPTIDEILKDMEKGSYKIGRHEFLSDLFRGGAIAISNKFAYREDREQEYLRIIKKYDKDMQDIFLNVFTKIYLLLTSQTFVGFNDYLGDLYMKSETSNSKAGQFFTPYSVSKMCAEMTLDEKKISECIEQDKILTLNEPTCGAGGMILGAVDVLYNKYNFNYARNLLVICSDVDTRCVAMTYLQLSLAGVPAIVYHQDTLTLKTWDVWETPAYIMQYMRFRNVLKK